MSSIDTMLNDPKFRKAVLEAISGGLKENMPIFKDYVNNVYLPFFTLNVPRHRHVDISRIALITAESFAEKPIDEVTENDLTSFMSQLQAKRGIKYSTLNRYRSRLVAIFNHAIKAKLIFANAASGLKRYKEQPRERVLSPLELKALLESCKESKNRNLYLITVIAIYTAMRQGEILDLRVNNIHDGCIYLDGSQTKSGYARKIPIHSELHSLLMQHIEQNACQDRLFNFNSFKSAFKTAIKRAKLHNFRFHDLRRTSATMMKNENSNLYAVCDILGHSSLEMTKKYLVSNFDELRIAIDSLPSLTELMAKD